jgi:hypothetical protein
MKITRRQLRNLIREQQTRRDPLDVLTDKIESMADQVDIYADRANAAGLHHVTGRWWKLLQRLNGLADKLEHQLEKRDI